MATGYYDCAAIRDHERVLAGELGGSLVLMERAAEALAAHLRQHWPLCDRVTVVCGPGNNGGDGYGLACLLRRAHRPVTVHALEGRLPERGDAVTMARRWVEGGGTVTPVPERLAPCELVVDALFGIGLSRAPAASAAAAIAAIDAAGVPVLSVDVPSGVDADTGRVPGVAVHATETLTFLADKPGLHTGPALDHVGRVTLEPLAAGAPSAAPLAVAADESLSGRWLGRRRRDSHKGHYGHVLVIGGERGYGGAVRLCGEAAMRCGAGLCTVATRPEHVQALLTARPELMALALADEPDLAAAIGRADVLVIGPGLGRTTFSQACLLAGLSSGKPCVLDADALGLLAASPWVLSGREVLTPHPGEAAALLGCRSADVQADRLGAARQLAERTSATVVLKGAGTVVASAGRTPVLLTAGNPGLATAGSGDVLAGVIGALRAQGVPPFEAAVLGADLHARAGDAAARAGERGLLACDLFAELRRLVNPGLIAR